MSVDDALDLPTGPRFVAAGDVSLFTDLYELTMLQAYWRQGMLGPAVFSLFVRRLPEKRNFLLAAGLDDALACLEAIRFEDDTLAFLAGRPEFESAFLDWLARFRFTGEVRALPEGTPFFADEPILEVVAPLPEAQLVETVVMNQIHLQTVAASKAVRVTLAAAGRTVVDFGMRRMHGVDAALKTARAFHIAGLDATSNVLAARVYHVPLAGTLAHSYIQAHDDELAAFRAFSALYPETILLVDTYDTLSGVRNVVRLARELGHAFRIRGVRLDSGDLGALAVQARRVLDDAGLQQVMIFASGGLDEHEIARLIERGAPIDAFGVGTSMGVSADAPSLDIAYKLVEYEGRGRMKLSTGKRLLPGAKQVFRVIEKGELVKDVLGLWTERGPGEPLLQVVMRDGKRVSEHGETTDLCRSRVAREVAALPARLRSLAPASPPFTVELSEALRRERAATERRIAGPAAVSP